MSWPAAATTTTAVPSVDAAAAMTAIEQGHSGQHDRPAEVRADQ
jgi:hypothetical protein